jgi:hypothetical protein
MSSGSKVGRVNARWITRELAEVARQRGIVDIRAHDALGAMGAAAN